MIFLKEIVKLNQYFTGYRWNNHKACDIYHRRPNVCTYEDIDVFGSHAISSRFQLDPKCNTAHSP